MQHYTQRIIYILALCFMLTPLSSFGENIEDEIIYLEADRVDIDDKTGVSTYTGRVKLSRGTVTINADKMFAYRSKEKLNKVTARGAPVYFTKTADKDNKEVKGEAQFIEYNVVAKTVNLTGDAKLWQDKDQFSGHSIKYDVAQKKVVAQKADTVDDRVRVVIYPKQEKTKSDNEESEDKKTQSEKSK